MISITDYKATADLKPWRQKLSRLGYSLVALCLVVALSLWSSTCVFGGYHCFDDGLGTVMAIAQWGILFGFILSLFGRGTMRMIFAGVAIMELLFCYSKILVH
jgi:hypothetical protein